MQEEKTWKKAIRPSWPLIGCLALTAAAGQEAIVNEFMADNQSTLRDADGASSDWIEIYNPGAVPVNLEGWFLTDDPADFNKWRFPAVSLAPGAYLVVFASGKDRAQGPELHTSFGLAAEGGYLALVQPDGATKAAEFAPYPPQRPDIAYGFGQEVQPEKLVATGAAAKLLVPSSGALGLSWTGDPAGELFNDSAAAGWLPVSVGIGYQTGTPVPPARPPMAAWSFDQGSKDLTGNGHDAVLIGASYSAVVPAALGSGRSLSFNGSNQYVSAEIDVSETSYTASLWFKANSASRGIFTVVDSDLGGNGHDRHLYLTGGNIGSRVWNNEVISSSGRNYADGRWHHLAHVIGASVSGQRIYIDGLLVASGSKAFSDFNWQQRINIGFSNDAANPYFDGLIDDVAIWDDELAPAQVQALAGGSSPFALDGYRQLIQTDIAANLQNLATSAYLRIPFAVQLPLDFNVLQLRLQYDDGFAAWLNGIEVARRNAPAAIAYNSAATADRQVSEGVRAEIIDMTAFVGLLRSGANLLAIHGLNDKAASADFLIAPELVKVADTPNRYLSPATPGAANVLGVLDFTDDPHFSVEHGFFSSPFTVALTCSTAGASIYYTINGSDPGPTSSTALLYAGPVSIARTTTLRAAAFKDQFKPSNAVTRTYIFPGQVAVQPASQPGLPSTWSGGFPADYGVDSKVVSTSFPGYSFTEALLSIPTVSLVTDPDNLFSPARGIYYNPEGRGPAWERPASIEWIDPQGGPDFQVNCGIRMHGNSSRIHGFTPKHPFRLLFRSQYGASKLRFRLFQDSRADRFDELLLRGASTDSWPVVDGGSVLGVQRWAAVHATYMRDQWMRDAQLALGRASCHGTYVHLYLNGLYWGLYNLAERPVDSFNANYFGGGKEEYDVLKDFAELEDGNMTAWNEMIALASAGLAASAAYWRIQGRNSDGARNPAFPVYLDVDNLIDYMILHISSGAEDWPHHNWWGARRRGPESTGFKFFVWDQEISNDSLIRQFTLFQTRFEDPVSSSSPSFLYGQLKANPIFKQKFIDRVHELLFNGGILSPEANSARWQARQAEIDQAIVGESARWGDSKRNPPYKREVEWLNEMNWMRDTYWNGVQPIAVERFRRVGLYPNLEAPVFRIDGRLQPGGPISAGARLAMTVPSKAGFIDTPLVKRDGPASAFVPGSDFLGIDWLGSAYAEGSRGEAWKIGANGVGYENSTGYESVIRINVGAEMSGAAGNNTVYVRLPFTIADAAALDEFQKVTLKMWFDDGFIAWLNGVKVAEANAPASPAWNSTATAGVEANLAAPVEYDIAGFRTALRAGQNLLAIQGLNFSNTSSDMLILAELVGRAPDNSVPVGDIYYTLNGADPKDAGAQQYGGPITLAKTILVKARTFDGSEWSALNQALYVVETDLPLRVTEVMYHPAAPPLGSPYVEDDFEFIELQNTGAGVASLLGVKISGGIAFDFSGSPVASLGPGDYVVVVRDLAAFRARYDTSGMAVAGEYQGKLDNAGDSIFLEGPLGEALLDFSYLDLWYPTTDGLGDSLVIIDPTEPPASWSDPASWRPSLQSGGSPGAGDGGGPQSGWQRPGDANQDGALDLGDAVRLLLHLFRGGAFPPPCSGAGAQQLLDVDGDGQSDISDAVSLLHYLFAGGDPPALGTGCIRLEGCRNVCAP